MNWNLTILNNTLIEWLIALGMALVINLAVGLIKWAVLAHLSQFAYKTSTPLDDSAIAIVRRTHQGLVLFVSLYISIQHLELPATTVDVFAVAATVAAFLQLGMWINGGFQFWMDRYRERAIKADISAATSLGAVAFVGKLLLWTVILLLGLDNLGVDVTALVAGLGVGGIAVALAMQNILGDLFASLSIVIDKPFEVGDFVIVDQYLGTVEYVGLKTTRVRSLGGEQLVFSNSDLLNSRIRNYKRMYERRVVFGFGVLYQTTADQLEAIPSMVRGIVEGFPQARFERAHFARFGESSLEYEVVYWMEDPDYNKYMDAQQAINLGIVRAFEEANLHIAYPTRTLYVENAVRVKGASPSSDGSGARPEDES